jgi:hypothetical protein
LKRLKSKILTFSWTIEFNSYGRFPPPSALARPPGDRAAGDYGASNFGPELAIDPARREPAEALRAEFEATVGKLGPLRERIKRTDELIDAIVYRLYGLSEEEIRIVEGAVMQKDF